MRKNFWKIVCCMLFCNVVLFADRFVGESIDERLDVVYSYYQNDWVMGLSDGSSWKLMPLKEKRKQTWTEWWNKVDPKEWSLSSEFFFDPRDWKGRFTIAVCEAKDSLAAGYNYILINQTTNQKVFAKYVPCGSDFIPKEEFALRITEKATPITSTLLSSYPFLENVIALEDKSIWKLYLRDMNSSSFSDWWNNVEIDQPDAVFLSKIGEWKNTDKIDIYHARFSDTELHQKYRVAKPLQEIFLLENKTRKKMAYATAVTFKDLLDGLQKHGDGLQEKGYSKGFSEGYNKGYKDGHSKGFADGVDSGKKEVNPTKKKDPLGK